MFELYGFDFLVDENFKTWILEANLSPALSIESDTDVTVKKGLLHDTFLVLDLAAEDGTKAYDEAMKAMEYKPNKRAEPPKPIVEKSTIWLPQRCGGFSKIYPFKDSEIEKQSKNVPKIGEKEMKTLLALIKKNL